MDKVVERIREVAERSPGIIRVLLFGSRARGDFREESDYDIAVLRADKRAQRYMIDRIDELHTLHKIDLVFLQNEQKDSKFYQNVIRDGVVIVDKFLDKLDRYKRAVTRLEEVIKKYKATSISELQDAVIKRFEFTAELSWKTAREYLLYLGETDINSPKPVMRAAFRTHLIADEDGWLDILDDRNTTSHIYSEDDADKIFENITKRYVLLFGQLLEVLEEKSKVA